jgi:iron complex outermembrane receptor protein
VNGSVGYTQVRLGLTAYNQLNLGNLQTALDSTTDPYLVGGVNSAANNAFIAPTLTTTDVSKLSFVHVGATHDLFNLSGGPMSIALGADYVHRSIDAQAPAAVANGAYSAGTTSISNAFTIGSQTVGSAYAELVAPITKQLEADFAARYDHYNLSGGKVSPKAGFKYQPLPELAFRGTASRGFRAPGPAENQNAGQISFLGSTNDPDLCADGKSTTPGNFPTQCSLQVGTVQGTNAALKPETSTSYTLGFILEPSKDLNVSVDYYRIQINNQIIAVAAPNGVVRSTNFAPIPQVQDDGTTTNVVPPEAPIAYFQNTYVNANKTFTSGFDVDLRYSHRFESVGNFTSEFMVTYMNKYDMTVDGVTYHLAGTHGPIQISGDTGNPKTRVQWSNTLTRGPLSVTGALNYISSFDLTDPSNGLTSCGLGALVGTGATPYENQLPDTVPGTIKCTVSSFTTFDLSGKYEITKGLSVHASILNLFNRGAPEDWGTYGGGTAAYNPSLHLQGAIGRYFTVGATYAF